MTVDISFGRWGYHAHLSLVRIAPGWWRLEAGPLAIEVDDQPSTLFTPRRLVLAALLALLLYKALP
jgi:hypothetical protein